jgi:branched-chain amino acid transport system permease protein
LDFKKKVIKLSIDIILQQLLNGISLGLGYALIAMGLTLIFGIIDVVNFAHGEYYMIGAYGLYIGLTILKLGYLPSILFSLLFVAIITFIMYETVLKRVMNRDPINAMLATFALSTLFINIVNMLDSTPKSVPTPFQGVINFGNIIITKSNLVIIVVSLIITVLLKLLLDHTKIGKQIRATGQQKEASVLMGIKVNRIYLYTFLIGCVLAAIAGMVLGTTTNAYPAMGQFVIMKAFAVVIFGGMGNVFGAFLAAIILGISESFGQVFLPGSWAASIAFVVMVLVLLVKPQGILGKGVK